MLKATPVGLLLAWFALAGGFAMPALALSASTIPDVTALTLISAITQDAIRTLGSNDTIVLSQDGSALNIRADVGGNTRCVAFFFDGVHIGTENVAPFAFATDDNGKFHAWTPPLGIHKLRAVPYSAANRTGTMGAAKEITLRVSSDGIASVSSRIAPSAATGTVTQLTLIDAATQRELRPLASGDRIALADVGTALNVRADVSGNVGSVAFYLNGAFVRCENVAPFAYESDESGAYRLWTPAIGRQTLRAVPYALANRRGAAGKPLEVTVDVTPIGSASIAAYTAPESSAAVQPVQSPSS